MQWSSVTTWYTTIDTFTKAKITKVGKDYYWNIATEELDLGFGDCGRTKIVASGWAKSLKEAKQAVREYHENH